MPSRNIAAIHNITIKDVKVDFDSIIKIIEKNFINNHLNIKEKSIDANTATFRAIRGNRIISVLIGIFPFGEHLLAGKRESVKVVIKNSNGLSNIYFNIAPWDEFWQMEEAPILTQNILEKVTDDYRAEKKLQQLCREISKDLNIEAPPECVEKSNKRRIKDILLNLLVFPLDGNRSSRIIHTPPERGPIINWGGLIIPEIYFLYNEIWGVAFGYLAVIGLVSFVVESLFEAKMIATDSSSTIIFCICIVSRIFFAFTGNKIFYLKHGRWP